MRSCVLVLCSIIVTLCLGTITLGQGSYDPVQDVTDNPLKSYHGSDIDSIELATGNLSVKVPLISYPQRGGVLHLDFSLIYSGVGGKPGTALIEYAIPNSGGRATWLLADVGGNHSLPVFGSFQTTYNNFPGLKMVNTQTGNSTSYTQGWIIDPDGSSHPLGWLNVTQGRTLDGTGFFVNAQGSAPSTVPNTIVDKYGVTTSNTSSSTTVTDPNGNQLTLANGIITDTMGKQISVPGSSSNWNVPGVNGSTETFVYGGAPNSPSLTLPNNTNYSLQFTPTTLPRLGGQTTAQTLPLLTNVTLPTGGSISYTYTTTPIVTTCSNSFHWYFPVLTRSVDANDGTGPHKWTYSYNNSSTSSATTTVIDPISNKTVYTYGLTSCKPYVTQIQRYDNSGNLLQTETMAYTNVGDDGQLLNLNLTNSTTLWANGRESQKVYSYDRDNGHSFQFGTVISTNYPSVYVTYWPTSAGYTDTPWTVSETDYGNGSPGPVLRQTKATYMAFNGPNASSYLANNLLVLPYTTQILNGVGAQMANTQFGYDESSLGSSGVGSSEQHAIPPPAGTYRGNQTSILRWLNSGTLTCQNGHTAGTGSNVTNKITYFDTGTVQTSADPCGNSTSFAYSNTYWGAYPTTVTNPLSQVTSHVFDFNTGLLTSTTDPNNLVTSYSYDSMWRVASVTRPDGGGDTITHQESSFPFTATLNTKLNTTITKSETNVFDGLGRVTQYQLTSDPQGTDFTDTTYDALGRVSTVSNPHRTCGTDTTSSCGITSYVYDALNRKKGETYPDGSVLQTAFCGASTLVTDPTKRWRRSRTDGLGRLVEVDEPNAIGATVASTGCPGNGEAIWVTNYTIDALGNLTNVLQNGSHPRSFTYDSLSRLQCSSNPESSTAACPAFGATTFPTGTLTYVYNPDGIVIKKTDARSIYTTYTYDALHRELMRTYSDGTPTVTTTYDQSACLGLAACQNIGHRTSMSDAAGSESWAYQQNNQAQYPDRPHILVDKRTTGGVTKTGTYWSDLAGNMTQWDSPTARRMYTAISAANRVVQVYNGPQYAFSQVPASPGCPINVVCYTPQGTIYSMSIYYSSSGFQGLNILETYNSRLQPQEIKASSSGGNAMDLSYNFVDPVNGGNAGHVFGITNNLDTTRSQTFTHDQVNRITAAQTTSTFATSPSHCWAETYQFDNSPSGGAWGNLTQITQPTNTGYTGCTYEVGFSKTADGNNHLSGFSYDASGNTSGDGYNSYTWNAESQLNVTGSSTYLYDGDGRRVAKANAAVPPVPYKLYWYGPGGEILGETDAFGNTLNDYVYLGGKRIAMLPAGANPILYAEDLLGTSRVNTTNAGVVCYDADFYPYGGERVPYTDTCTQNFYKFEGKERDPETGNDDFGARYYSNRFGRWLSADWSNVPVAVPYANLSNPQTLNLYSMVADDPESFADLDGHGWWDDFKERLHNWAYYGHLVLNKDLNKALEKDAQRMLEAMRKRNIQIDDKTSDEYFKGKSNTEIADAYNQIESMRMGGSLTGAGPLLPAGMNNSDFGKNVMKWGTGDNAARQRIATLTREELERAGVTKEMAQSWRDFYKAIKALNSGNPSAQGRAELMQKAYELLGGK